ncbi:MAG: hypothetical protein QOJ19_4726, partial [Acidimicrobiia bacterium]|nr:hypothetical protein [Acidimicrobiia bacterium]
MGAGGRLRSSLQRIAKACEAHTDQRELRLEVISELRSVLGFDAFAWLLTDPETSVGCAPLADVPCVDELPRLIRLKYLTALNRWTTLASESAVSGLHDVTEGELSKSLLWREMLHEFSIIDVASMVFQDRFGRWGFLDLWRTAPAGVFRPDELAFLAELSGLLTAGLRRCLAWTFIAAQSIGSPWPGPVVLLLSPDLEVLGQTPDTREYLRVLVPPGVDRAPVPANAYNAAAQLLALEAGIDTNPPFARVHLAAGVWVTTRAARIGERSPPEQRNITVTIQATS